VGPEYLEVVFLREKRVEKEALAKWKQPASIQIAETNATKRRCHDQNKTQHQFLSTSAASRLISKFQESGILRAALHSSRQHSGHCSEDLLFQDLTLHSQITVLAQSFRFPFQ
jgi:hypothetical protein